eukprot:CAMPEP_0194037610 /NCGR_PEP_ID=MMETSP0009_2-20130614/9953_1 /TAXON_ID=210454 /ORGANISM="Grammatophora oceanica, Strain CCMP 410" /LENGTH=270 /DNA_ID=CAMNT_0038679845 /DNA_START=126 /DNA_END=938 /DNA_ORIENTATION=+
MAWASVGSNHSSKTALIIPGGPGNAAPTPEDIGGLENLVEYDYQVFIVTRPQNMPKYYTVQDIARDYARMIKTEFGGHVDLIIGTSYGGMICQFLAATFKHIFNHIVLVVAACEVNPPCRSIDLAYANALAQGRPFAAGAAISKEFWPHCKLPILAKLAGGILHVAKTICGPKHHEHFANDVVIEAESEETFDSRPVLPYIKVPVLLIAGEYDYVFPLNLIKETVALIPDCRLRLYMGKGHTDVLKDDHRVVRDIVDFVRGQEIRSVLCQ